MRPKLDCRLTIRLPEEMLQDLGSHADRRGTSVNDVVLTSLENELARLLTYRLNYYAQVRPLAAVCQGDSVSGSETLSDKGLSAVPSGKVV